MATSRTPLRLIFRDLFAYASASLAYVRVYLGEDWRGVALVVDPSDNPGQSAVNAAEWLVDDLRQAFLGVHELRVFAWFAGSLRDRQWTEIVIGDDGVEFGHVEHSFVEELVGWSVDLPAGDEGSCRDLGGEGHPLLALVPAPEPERHRLADLAVVPVADLPWPHNPSSCAWAARFEEILALYPESTHPPPAAGAHWFLSLDETDLRACRFHEANWRRIADVSVEVLGEVGTDRDAVAGAISARLDDPVEADWCDSLFADPIAWSPGQTSVVNGQHRACALRASGASWCVVDLRGGSADNRESGDPRAQAAADVASFWVQRAARTRPP